MRPRPCTLQGCAAPPATPSRRASRGSTCSPGPGRRRRNRASSATSRDTRRWPRTGRRAWPSSRKGSQASWTSTGRCSNQRKAPAGLLKAYGSMVHDLQFLKEGRGEHNIRYAFEIGKNIVGGVQDGEKQMRVASKLAIPEYIGQARRVLPLLPRHLPAGKRDRPQGAEGQVRSRAARGNGHGMHQMPRREAAPAGEPQQGGVQGVPQGHGALSPGPALLHSRYSQL